MGQHSKKWHEIHTSNLRKRIRRKKSRKIEKAVSKEDTNRIYAPENLCLFNPKKHARRYFLKFLAKLNKPKPDQNITIDFRETKMVYPCGAAAIYATIDRLKSNGYRLSLAGYKFNNRTHQILQQIGLLELITPNLPKIHVDRDDVVHWSLNKGARINPTQIREAIEENIQGRDISEEAKKTLKKAIMESIENTQQWAYPNRNQKPWWVLWQIKDETLTICVCDLGVTIPKSLENTWKESITDIAKFFYVTSKHRNAEGKMIERATQVARSATGEANRGHGFGKIIDFAKKNEGLLRIYSGRGIFYEKWKPVSKDIRGTRQRFDGTLIHWNIELKNEQVN